MQYLEKIKKINELAKDLLSQGIANDAAEASKMAEQLVEKEEKGIADMKNVKIY